MTLLAETNIPVPDSLGWILSGSSFFFAAVTNGSLATDCLLSDGPMNLAFKTLLLHLIIPLVTLVLLAAIQMLW